MALVTSNRNVIKGLTAAFLIIPSFMTSAHAQAIDEIIQQTSQRANNGFSYGLNSFCYIAGACLLAGAVLAYYLKHKNNTPGITNGRILSAFLAGGCLIGFPYLVKTTSFTFWNANTSVTGEQQMMHFDK